MGCGTSRQTRVHPSGAGQQLNATPVSATTQTTPSPSAVQVQSIGVQTDNQPPPSSQHGVGSTVDVIVVQSITQSIPESTTVIATTHHTQQDKSDKNEEIHLLEHHNDEEASAEVDVHSVVRSQGSQTSLKPHPTDDVISDNGTQTDSSKLQVKVDTANVGKDDPASLIDEVPKNDSQMIDETEGSSHDKENEGVVHESMTNGTEEEGKQLLDDRMSHESLPTTDGNDICVESSAILKPTDELKPAIDEHTSVTMETNCGSTTSIDKMSATIEQDQPPESTASPQAAVDNDNIKPEEDTSKIDKSEPAGMNASLFLKPILPQHHDGLTVTTSEPRLPVLPPISIANKQGVTELKSKSASDVKRQSAGKVLERGEGNLGKIIGKSRSTSVSSLSRSQGTSGSVENMVKKSTSRESLRSGSRTHLKASSSSLHLQKNNDGLSSKKLSLSRESLKAANLVYTSSKSRESLKSGGKLSSRSKNSLKSNKSDGGKAEIKAETTKLSSSNPTHAVAGKPADQKQQQTQPMLECSTQDAMSAETEGQAVDKDDAGDKQVIDEKKTTAEETQPKEKSPTTKESKGVSEMNELVAHVKEVDDKETEQSEAHDQREEQTIETKFEIDHQTGQSEQSIVEAVEKSLKIKGNGTTGESPPALTTTVQ